MCVFLRETARAIYSNKFGFPTGVAWAILCARICQMYPRSLPCTLLEKFFRVYDRYPWPTPVKLTAVEDPQIVAEPPHFNDKIVYGLGGPGLMMPILTPAYPVMNTTYNIGQCNKRVLVAEFKRGLSLTCGLKEGGDAEAMWRDLWAPSDFFLDHKTYLQIDVMSRSLDQHVSWQGYVESQLRKFIENKQRTGVEDLPGIQAVPYPYPIKVTPAAGADAAPFCDAYFIALDAAPVPAEPVKPAAAAAAAALTSASLAPPPPQIDLTTHVQNFITALKAWPKFQPGMNIVIKTVKAKDLPEPVFHDERCVCVCVCVCECVCVCSVPICSVRSRCFWFVTCWGVFSGV